MEIGILGTGTVGKTLAAKLAAAGHTVKVGSRTPETAGQIEGAAVVSHREAIASADVIVNALPGAVAERVRA